MKKLTLIRLATYALFIACIFYAEQRHFITVRLPLAIPDGNGFEYHDIHNRARPRFYDNFHETKLSGSDLTRIATRALEKEGLPFHKLSYRDFKLSDTDDGDLIWIIMVSDQWGNERYMISILDPSGRASVQHSQSTN